MSFIDISDKILIAGGILEKIVHEPFYIPMETWSVKLLRSMLIEVISINIHSGTSVVWQPDSAATAGGSKHDAVKGQTRISLKITNESLFSIVIACDVNKLATYGRLNIPLKNPSPLS